MPASAILRVYQLNRWIARKLLIKAESAILEVDEAELDENGAPLGRMVQYWRRFSRKFRAVWQKINVWFGDPFEPWSYKLWRLTYFPVSWVMGKVIGMWNVGWNGAGVPNIG